MGNPSFLFKRFEVRHDRCAMRVGTDGVLLGAWASGGRRILDVGTGTGLIAMMMAQRFPEAFVTAIDIDNDAAIQASENVARSCFSNRIAVTESPFQQFAPAGKYDCIVSNPPFFPRDEQQMDNQRCLARHTDSLSYAELFGNVARLLSDNGVFSAVIPVTEYEKFESEAYLSGLFLWRRCRVKTVERKAPKRCLLAYKKAPCMLEEDTTEILQMPDGQRSEWYHALTQAFYVR